MAWKAAPPVSLLLCTCPQGGGFASCLSSVPRAETTAPTYEVVAGGCTLPLSCTLTSSQQGSLHLDLGWSVLAHWLNHSWLSSFYVKLGLGRYDTSPNIECLGQALRHRDKASSSGALSIEGTVLGFEPLNQSSESWKPCCPYFWAPSIMDGTWIVAQWGRQRIPQVAAFIPPPCLPSLPLGLLASAACWLLTQPALMVPAGLPLLRQTSSNHVCSQIDLVQTFADRGPVSTNRLKMPHIGLFLPHVLQTTACPVSVKVTLA